MMTVIYYTSNHLETTNPVFLDNTKRQLAKAIGDLPLICVSQKPVEKFINGEYENVVLGDIGRSHLNIYRQILEGTKRAKTPYVAMAEDDILYSYEHFHSQEILKNLKPDVFLYDMMKLSLFTWTTPQIFSFRTKRKVVNQLIAPRDYLIDALEERFKLVNPQLKFWGDPGRYEEKLGVSPRKSFEVYCDNPSIVFSHPEAFGYLSQGTRKKHGDLRIIEVVGWGKASDVAKAWYEKTVW